MIQPLRRIGPTALSFALATAAMAQPSITRLNKSEFPRSGRVAIEGSGFGTAGEVVIAGLSAMTGSWTDTRIVAYVPEAAPLGSSSLRVDVQGQQSNSVDLTVTTRQPNGRIKWTFETEGTNQWWRPALAPDGTIYVHTTNLVYALSPGGALLWIQQVNAYPYVPPTAGPDGAVYVGGIGTIYRISSEGAIDWQYNPADGASIKVSPTIGPDGLLYGAFEFSGVFAIEPLTGNLVWSNPGNPFMSDKASDSVETKFGPSGPGQPVDQIYVSMEGQRSFWAFSTTGDQLFTASLSNLGGSAEAAIGSDGTIYGPRGLGLTVVAIDPSDGTVLWQYYPSDWAVGTNNVEIGPDDTLYFVGSSAKLEAFDPHSQTRQWQFFNPDNTLGRPTVTPDGSTLILAGSDTGIYGHPGFVKAFGTRNGHELWTVDLPFQLDPNFRVYGVHHPRITPDGTTAYLSTISLTEYPQDPHTFLFAIDITSGGGGPGGDPCNDDGVCSVGEDCLGCPGDCPGQTSGNPADRWCCGDGECSGPEDGFLCPLDCGPPVACGDGTCDAGESVCDCPVDCGAAPPDEVPGATCADGIDNDCDGAADCGDAGCGIAESVYISTVNLDESALPILTFQDPNPPAAVTGYNVYRSDDPGLAYGAWPQLASDVTDMDETTPDHQWVDTSGDGSAGGIWYYQVAAFGSVCSTEGPW